MNFIECPRRNNPEARRHELASLSFAQHAHSGSGEPARFRCPDL